MTIRENCQQVLLENASKHCQEGLPGRIARRVVRKECQKGWPEGIARKDRQKGLPERTAKKNSQNGCPPRIAKHVRYRRWPERIAVKNRQNALPDRMAKKRSQKVSPHSKEGNPIPGSWILQVFENSVIDCYNQL